MHVNSPGGVTMSTLTPEPSRSTAASAGGSPPMHESNLEGLNRIHQGKVRDIYEIPGDPRHMLIVTTDRLSAFDVVLPDPIPGKGRVLTSISNFWFARTGHIVPNHLAAAEHADLARDRTGRGRPRPTGRPGDGRAQAQGAARRGGRARLPDRVRLEGLPAHRRRSAASGCPPACAGGPGCPSRSSRPRPRRRKASTTRTSASTRSRR